MSDQQVYKCDLCGADVMAALAYHHDCDGERRSFCSAEHRLEWLELNEVMEGRDVDAASK
jgi:hypothetical protein